MELKYYTCSLERGCSGGMALVAAYNEQQAKKILAKNKPYSNRRWNFTTLREVVRPNKPGVIAMDYYCE